jgi:tripartite ATP-independent transporter DctP family solute receptor
MRKHAVSILLLVALAVAGAALGEAATYKPEYKASIVVGPSGPWGESAIRFADLVKERTKGRINIKNYHAGQLFAGKQTNEFTLLAQSVGDFAFASTINWSPQVKELNLFAMPFMYPSYKGLDNVEAREPGKKLFQLIESKGIVPLAWGENGFRQVTNSKRAIKTPSDLDGLKIRVVGSPIFIDTFRALGANPVNMNWGEAQTAFQQGTVDGQENPVVTVIIPSKLWTTQKYITLWNYTIDPLILGVSKISWDAFTAEDKGIVKQAALEIMAWQKAGARAGLEGAMENIEILKKNGMEVHTFAAKDIEVFRGKTKAVYDNWAGQIGTDLVKAAEKIVAETK